LELLMEHVCGVETGKGPIDFEPLAVDRAIPSRALGTQDL
jgi:hypothetical protein